jgi:hypothetical protein
VALVVAMIVPISSLHAQSGELARLIALYRSGSVEAAVAGLLAYARVEQSFEQRALAEYHLGIAQLRTRPSDAAAALRRSIALDPDLRPDSNAVAVERKAWDNARAQMSVPREIRFDPPTTIVGAGDSVGIIVDVPSFPGALTPRIRVLLAIAQERDPVELWSGTAGQRGKWDGSFRGVVPQSGSYPLIVEVFGELGEAPIRWRRSLNVTTEMLPQPAAMTSRPQTYRTMIPIRVIDRDSKQKARNRGLLWALGGSVVSFAATRMAPNAVNMSAPNGGPRIAVASMYGAGLASAVYGGTKVMLSAIREYETTVLVPDEAELRRQRAMISAWQADSVQAATFDPRRESRRRVTFRIQERR